jgi:hypothetical protein
LWITSNGLIASPSLPSAPRGNWSVTLICSNGTLKIYELVKGPWICRVEALNLLGTAVRSEVFWNSTVKGVNCGERYLFSDLKQMVVKGKEVVIMIPLSGSTCKRVRTNAYVINNTMIINITTTPIKPWVKICPPSKMMDVIIAWGRAKAVKAYVDGKEVLYVKSK